MSEKEVRNELHLLYRPQNFDELIGNDALKESLVDVCKRTRTFLFHGSRGCGKTTIARLLAYHLEIDDFDIREIDAADKTGVEDAREIKSAAQFLPAKGKKKIFIIDECFSPNTQILTKFGNQKIEDIKVGDFVYGLGGFCRVKNLFKNKVEINRVAKITISENESIFCSEDHLFFTNNGWKKACNLLKKDLVFSVNSNMVYNKKILFTEDKNEKVNREEMSLLRSGFYNLQRKNARLFRFLLSKIKKSKIGIGTNCRGKMRDLRRQNSNTFEQKKTKEILFSKMCKYMEKFSRIFSREDIFPRSGEKNKQQFIESSKREERGIVQVQLGKDEIKQPLLQPGKYRKDEGNKTEERKSERMDREKRRKRAFNSPANITINRIGLGYGSCNKNRKQPKGRKWISNLLQGRYWGRIFEGCNRSRWRWSQIERKFNERSKKRKEISLVRVESVEIYQRGNNESSFSGIISDKEKNQGFIEFYDLEIEGHPSYTANGIFVHNCHRFSVQAWDTLLKTLEEPPLHCVFALCTTDFAKIPATIKSRSKIFQVNPLMRKEAKQLIDWVCAGEGIKINDNIKQKIIASAEGVPREMIIKLDTVRNIKNEENAIALLDDPTNNPQFVELCNALLDKKKWDVVSKIVSSMSGEPEKLRYAVLEYMAKVLISKDSQRASEIITMFSDSYMYVGRAGLINACYLVTRF